MSRARKVLLTLAAVIVVSVLGVAAWLMPAQSRPYDVIAVLGQSNAAGAGKGLDMLGKDGWDSKVYQLGAFGPTTGVVLPGADPLMHPDPDFRAIGFGTTFAKRYAAETGRDVLLVPVAAKSTGFVESNGMSWDTTYAGSGTSLYKLAVGQISDALSRNPENRLAGVLWLQGESDTSRLTGSEYSTHLRAVVEGLRSEFGNAPFIAGQMSPDWIAENAGVRGPINAVHEALPSKVENSAFVPGPSGMHNEGDPIHYNAEGQREMGNRFWSAYQSLRNR